MILSLAIWRAVRPGAPHDTPPAPETPKEGYISLLRQRAIWRVLVLGVVTFGPITTITGLWGGPFLQDALGLQPDTAGAVLLVFFLATILGGYIFGVLDRKARSRRTVIFWGAACSVVSLTILAGVGPVGRAVPIALLLGMIFFQQFYIPLGAELRHAVPDHMLGRASTLLALVSVAAIPVLQITFGALLDIGASWDWQVADQYRLAFAGLAGVIAVCLVLYMVLGGREDAVQH
ncbi:MFS transporter [Sulfitobacter aestuariivivens]|uniref:MFS transporter n=1 Tax=Sulfitobacter aestuariivivens TaxID=2766981 RepID=UPI00362349D5